MMMMCCTCKSMFCILHFSDPYRHIPMMNPNRLRALESVEEITDYLWVDTNFTGLRHLNFLSNLRVIYGRNTEYAPFQFIVNIYTMA